MTSNSFNQFIMKSLEYYDNKVIKNVEYLINQDIKITDNEIEFNIDKKNVYKNYEFLGYFDYTKNIWVWGWTLNYPSDKLIICRSLLNYGINLEEKSNTNEHYYIKPLLVNSRFVVEEDIGLNLNLAVISSLIKDRISFILPYRKSKTLTYYYLIK